MQIISLIQNIFNKEKCKWQCNVKFDILDIYCKEYFYYVNQTQNHRMLGVGRDLCGSSSPTALAKTHLKNIMAGSSLLENKQTEI